MEEKLEVQLFYINDKNSALEDILGSFKANKSVDMTSLLQCCVDSIKRSNPNVKITLVTDAATKIHKGVQGIKVIETEKISHKSLIYDLFVYRRDYIEKNIDKNLNIVFADIDVLFNCDLRSIFETEIDFRTAIWSSCPYEMNDRGLPTAVYPHAYHYTGGTLFVKCNDRTLSFFNSYLRLWKELYEKNDFANYGPTAQKIKANFFQWWGGLHTFCVMAGTEVLSGAINQRTISSCKFSFLDEDDYNYAPDCDFLSERDPIIKNIAINKLLTDLKSKKLIHFRGHRKRSMAELYSKLSP